MLVFNGTGVILSECSVPIGSNGVAQTGFCTRHPNDGAGPFRADAIAYGSGAQISVCAIGSIDCQAEIEAHDSLATHSAARYRRDATAVDPLAGCRLPVQPRSRGWTAGDNEFTFYGGTCRETGERSHVTIHSIIAVKRSTRGRHVQRHIPPLNNHELFRRDGYMCMYCGTEHGPGELTRDHIKPLSKGGRDVWSNVVTACRSCNTRKGSRTPERAGMPLLAVPFRAELGGISRVIEPARFSPIRWNSCVRSSTARVASETSRHIEARHRRPRAPLDGCALRRHHDPANVIRAPARCAAGCRRRCRGPERELRDLGVSAGHRAISTSNPRTARSTSATRCFSWVT